MCLASAALSLIPAIFISPAPQLQQHDDNAAAVLTFPVPEKPLSIPAASANLEDLIREYARATGQSVTMRAETQQWLQQTPIILEGAPVTVSPDRVQMVVESLLSENDFVLTVVTAANPRILSVISLNTAERTTIKDKAVYVSSDRIALMRAHPAMVFTTSLTLANLDPRQLANSMRTLITDANIQQLLPAGASKGLLISGMGPQVAGWIEMLQRLDADARTEQQDGDDGGENED